MAEQELRKLLDQLHGELDQVDHLDQAEREMLRHLASDIEKRLDPSIDENPPLVGGLQDAIQRFEADHPTLTNLLSDALTALSNAGI